MQANVVKIDPAKGEVILRVDDKYYAVENKTNDYKIGFPDGRAPEGGAPKQPTGHASPAATDAGTWPR